MKKTNYVITEKQNVNSQREGKPVACETLRGAKMAAGRMQCFQGTVMTVEDEKGNLVAYRSEKGVWLHFN